VSVLTGSRIELGLGSVAQIDCQIVWRQMYL